MSERAAGSFFKMTQQVLKWQKYLLVHNNIYDSIFICLFIVCLLSMTIIFIQANSSPTDNMPSNIYISNIEHLKMHLEIPGPSGMDITHR